MTLRWTYMGLHGTANAISLPWSFMALDTAMVRPWPRHGIAMGLPRACHGLAMDLP